MFVEIETQWNEKLYVNPKHIIAIVMRDNGTAQINYVDGDYHIVKGESVDKLVNLIITD